MNNIQDSKCPGCRVHESWEHFMAPCLACQLAGIVFQNPFTQRYRILLDIWLPVTSDTDSKSENTECSNIQTPRSISTSCITPSVDQDELLRL
jgi:hypothetical protein